jgi:hypothetical protein
MRKLIFTSIVMLFGVTNLNAQTTDSVVKSPTIKTDSLTKFTQEKFEFTLIDTISKTKDELFLASLTWIATNFKSSKDVIQIQDKDAGKIILKGIISLSGSYDFINFMITIDVKDNKYRIIMHNFEHEGGFNTSARTTNPTGGKLSNDKPDSGWMFKKRWLNIKEETELNTRKLLKNYRKSMKAIQIKDDF